MSMRMLTTPAVLLALFITTHPAPAATTHDPEKIIETIDALYRTNSSTAVVEMEIATPDWKRTMKFRIITSGMNRTFIEIQEPPKDKGIKTLRIDREMWNFFPRINKVMKVPPSMMMGSWMGSDFTNDDLVREVSLKNDYAIKMLPESGKGTLRIGLTAKPGVPTVWARIIIEVDAKSLLPEKQEFYDDNGKLMRVMEFRNVKEIGGRTIPTEMVVKPLNKEGHSTTVRYLDATFDKPVSEDTFTMRHLQSR